QVANDVRQLCHSDTSPEWNPYVENYPPVVHSPLFTIRALTGSPMKSMTCGIVPECGQPRSLCRKKGVRTRRDPPPVLLAVDRQTSAAAGRGGCPAGVSAPLTSPVVTVPLT